jgi:endo-1,4-beta-xylanase
MGIVSTALLLSLASASAYADGLNARAKGAGKLYFGSAVDNGDLSDSQYLPVLRNTQDFGQITPANTMKWDSIEPQRNQFNYGGGDTIANLAAQNGQMLRCHALVWHNQLPGWVTNSRFDNATLISVLQNHIKNEVTHYKGKCYAWDVVNEALNEDGTYRSDVFLNTIGPSYIPIAFAAAAAADPNAKLYYNDYNIETAGAKATGAQNIVKLVKQYGAKIDGVGLQGHLVVGQVPSASTLASVLTGFTNLGVEVAYTELDIRTNTPASSSALQQQATDYGSVITACKNVPKCVGVTLWDFTDKHSWVPGTFPGQGAACPWDQNYNKKPAYTGILNAWGTGGVTSATSITSDTTLTTSVTVPTTTPITTTTPPATTASGTGATQTHWGQCGGNGWTGPTTCESPYTCKYQNPWYSQCL